MNADHAGIDEAAQQQMAGELRALKLTAEELLEHAAHQAGESGAQARARLAAALEGIKARLAALDNRITRAAGRSAASADLYVHKHPWQSVAIGAAAAASVGFLLGLLVGRR